MSVGLMLQPCQLLAEVSLCSQLLSLSLEGKASQQPRNGNRTKSLSTHATIGLATNDINDANYAR